MKVLMIGSGGRESAWARKIAKSELADNLICAPGNPGTASFSKNVPADLTKIKALRNLALSERVNFVFVGPEGPLVAGLGDLLEESGIDFFGPNAKAAQLEGSKIFAKLFMRRHGIPTADYWIWPNCRNFNAIDHFGLPIVIKADGLFAGKGVIVCNSKSEFRAGLERMKSHEFKPSGRRLFLIEEFLFGSELSYIVVIDKKGNFKSLAMTQDHKRAFNHDSGIFPNPNTGGMGAYSPVPFVTPELDKRIIDEIVRPTINGMRQESLLYPGILYFGLMINGDGDPSVLEFNVRGGDPESETIAARMISDPMEIFMAAIEDSLNRVQIKWDPRPAVSIVITSGGYPGKYETGYPISGLEEARETGVIVDHAGTALNSAGKLVTAGGRVMIVTALGDTFREAQEKAYAAVQKIHWPGCHYRTDIGWQACLNEPL